MELVARKAAVEQIRQEYAFSRRRACGLLAMAVPSCRYVARVSDEALRSKADRVGAGEAALSAIELWADFGEQVTRKPDQGTASLIRPQEFPV